MGGIGKMLTGSAPKAAKQNKAGFLRPFGFTSPLYNTDITIDEDQKNFGVNTTGDDRLGNIMNTQLGAVDGLTQQHISALQGRPQDFNYNFNPEEATQSYFNAGMDTLNPAFEQQQQQMQNNLFGSGRMGLQLASGAAGGGAGSGMVNPDAFGLGLAQSQAMTDLYGQSRAAAMNEGNQMFNQQLTGMQQNEANRQNYLQQLGVGQSGLLNQALGMDENQRAAASEALKMEAIRGGMIAGTPYGGGTPGSKGLLQAGAEAYIGAQTGGMFGGGGGGMPSPISTTPYNASGGAMNNTGFFNR